MASDSTDKGATIYLVLEHMVRGLIYLKFRVLLYRHSLVSKAPNLLKFRRLIHLSTR